MNATAKPALKPQNLYSGDNGRIFCGEQRCAGVTAHWSGRTLAGQKVRKITAAYAALWPADLGPLKCECCKKVFTK